MNEPDEQVLAWEGQFFEETGKSARHLLDPLLAQREAALHAEGQRRLLGIARASFYDYQELALRNAVNQQNGAANQRDFGLANALGQAFR